ncbi:MAG: hypothetical protein AAF346_00505 [Pseudomonadota bacterium]
MTIVSAIIGIVGLFVMAVGIAGVVKPHRVGLQSRMTAQRIATAGLTAASLGPILAHWYFAG